MTATSSDRGRGGCDCGCAEEIALVRAELAALRAEVARLSSVADQHSEPGQKWQVLSSARASERLAAERVGLFRSLFVGRDDVYAQRWERDGRKGWYPQLERLPGQTW